MVYASKIQKAYMSPNWGGPLVYRYFSEMQAHHWQGAAYNPVVTGAAYWGSLSYLSIRRWSLMNSLLALLTCDRKSPDELLYANAPTAIM